MFRSYFVNLLLSYLPVTRLFSLKAICLRYAGVDVGKDTYVTGSIKLYGRGGLSVGANGWLGIGCRFYIPVGSSVVIGDRCDIAPEVKFVCGSHRIGTAERRAGEGFADDIVVGAGSWIGVGSTLLAGVRIGEGSVVAAGAVVTPGRYPANALLAGVPAKVVKIYDP
ncbi:acyltransferase [Methylococcus capsulatus]|uniref:acyltransferase n=1 Tax=Methylococcus capsulatus TaxID=414 RepID=UPI0009DA5C85|nr:acyltransferase [Methylococcus capsulatus]